jgi:hypothetical protein
MPHWIHTDVNMWTVMTSLLSRMATGFAFWYLHLNCLKDGLNSLVLQLSPLALISDIVSTALESGCNCYTCSDKSPSSSSPVHECTQTPIISKCEACMLLSRVWRNRLAKSQWCHETDTDGHQRVTFCPDQVTCHIANVEGSRTLASWSHTLVSGPSASCRNDSRSRSRNMAHMWPNTRLYHSGHRPLERQNYNKNLVPLLLWNKGSQNVFYITLISTMHYLTIHAKRSYNPKRLERKRDCKYHQTFLTPTPSVMGRMRIWLCARSCAQKGDTRVENKV